MIIELYAKSDVGRVRRGNEDNFLVLDLTNEQTWTGADGAVPPEKLKRFDLGEKGLVLVVSMEWVAHLRETALGGWLLVQVGDSRGYIIRKNQIRLATKDQSLVQQLVDVGQISESEAETHMFRNVILQALGAQSEIAPVTGKIRLRQGDILLLCSDGLSGKLRAEDIQQIVLNSNGDLVQACSALVEEANNRGGEDNITVVLARFVGDDLEPPTTERITIELPPLEEDKTLDDNFEADTEPQ